MNADSFLEYASGKLTPDEIYTVEMLIDKVQYEFDPDYWEKSDEKDDARERPDYEPHFEMAHLKPAAAELKKLTWLSFQRLRDKARPIRDLTVLQHLPELTGLVLVNNQVSDLSPLQNCTKLRRLCLTQNRIKDISPLTVCINLEELDVAGLPISDFSPLQHLPSLRKLSISVDQLPAFRKLKAQPSIQTLDLGLDVFESFEGFPVMTELRAILSPTVRRLDGLEKFLNLQNLVNVSGSFDSLEPVRELRHLTHINILNSRVRTLEPLSNLIALRSFQISTEERKLDLRPLERLPALHSIAIKCADREPPSVARLRSGLSSWDLEFRAEKPRHTPSLELQVVDQPTFDYYDSDKKYGMSEGDTNEQMLSSELEWLDDQLEHVFVTDFKKDEDYAIPFRWGGARSRTVVLMSDPAVEAFPRLVLGIQKVLCHANKDWIIYFQSDEAEIDFVVWIYPDKIMVAKEYASVVRSLIKPK